MTRIAAHVQEDFASRSYQVFLIERASDDTALLLTFASDPFPTCRRTPMEPGMQPDAPTYIVPFDAMGSLAAALSPHNPDHATAEELAGAKAEVSMLKECLAVERRRVDLTLGIPQAPCANCGHRPIDHGLLGLGGPCIQPGCDCRYLLKETA